MPRVAAPTAAVSCALVAASCSDQLERVVSDNEVLDDPVVGRPCFDFNQGPNFLPDSDQLRRRTGAVDHLVPGRGLPRSASASSGVWSACDRRSPPADGSSTGADSLSGDPCASPPDRLPSSALLDRTGPSQPSRLGGHADSWSMSQRPHRAIAGAHVHCPAACGFHRILARTLASHHRAIWCSVCHARRAATLWLCHHCERPLRLCLCIWSTNPPVDSSQLSVPTRAMPGHVL